MNAAASTDSSLTKEECQQLENRLRFFPPTDVSQFKSGVLSLPIQARDRALFNWVMGCTPPKWYAAWVLENQGLDTKAIATNLSTQKPQHEPGLKR